MSMTLPPSLFFGKKKTSGETKIETGVKLYSKKTREPPTSASAIPSNNTRNLRTRKTAINETPQQNPRTPSNKSVKNVKTPQEKNPVYKHAFVDPTIVEKDTAPVLDEYEFQVETPEGSKKKSKKRQPRQKNKVQTLWGLTVRCKTKKYKPSKKVILQEPENVKPVDKVIQPSFVHKDLQQPCVKKVLAPLQERTGNTLSQKITLSVGGGIVDNHKGNLVGIMDEKKKTDKSTSGDFTKQLRTKQTKEEVKENRPLGKKKTLETSGAKLLHTPLNEKTPTAYSNSTPLRSLVSPPAINNMSVVLSPIHGEDHAIYANQTTNQSSRGKSIHASTPVLSGVRPSCEKTSSANISLKEISPSNSQSKNQVSISGNEFRQCTSHALGKKNSASKNSDISEHHYVSNSDQDFDDTPNAENVVPNDCEELPLSSSFDNQQLDRVSSSKEATKIKIPVTKTEGTWRLLPTVRYNFNIEPVLDNCFGFDDEEDAANIDVNQLMEPNILENIVTQHRPKPCSAFQKTISPKPVKKPCNQLQKKTLVQPEKGPEKQHNTRSQDTVLPRQVNIDDLLESSLTKLRKRKRLAADVFSDITSEDDLQPSSSSQLTQNDVEKSTTSSSHPPVLFEDFEKDDILRSPFMEPPRRSYQRLRRLKRLVDEDEDEDEEEEEEEEDDKRKKEKKKTSKRNKTVYKRRKMVQTTLLDQWAKEISCHFAEVDDTDLLTE